MLPELMELHEVPPHDGGGGRQAEDMKVQDVCTRDPWVCPEGGTLADAARIMWDGDCGSLPVVDATGAVVGMISDRDITMSALTKDRPPSLVQAREVMSGKVFSCRSGDDLRDALRTMASRRVRRLPVLDEQGGLRGILSISDCLRHAAPPLFRESGVPPEELVAALKALSTPWKEFFGKARSADAQAIEETRSRAG